MALALRYAARSDVGLLREGNEDSAYAGPRLLVVADGIGGAVAGEVASSMVVATLAPLDEDPPGPDLLDRLSRAVAQANEHLGAMVKGDPTLDGMGTTLTALLRAGGRLGLIHVGDSRGYLLRDGRIQQITKDHSWVQALIDDGRLTPEEAGHHPQRSVILQALDGRTDIEPDLSMREARIGDRYLLCSDGLSDVVSAETLEATLREQGDPGRACEALVELALRGGGPDNITCVVADIVDVDDAPSTVPQVVGAVAEGRAPRRSSGGSAAAKAAALKPSVRSEEEPATSTSARTGPGSGRRWTMRLLLLVAVLAVAGGGSIAAYGWSQRQYYVGADGGSVAIFRGVDQKLAWVSLSRVEERAPIPLDALPTFHRNQVDSSIAALSLEDARRIVSNLQDQADACAKQGTAVTTPPAGPTATPAATPPPAGPPSARVAPTPGPGVTGLTPSRPATPAPSRPPRLDCTGAQP